MDSLFVRVILWAALPLLLAVASPARAELHGGVEIGAKGIKATALDVTPTKSGYDIKILMAQTQNTTISAKIGDTGVPEADALKETVQSVADFLAKMQTEHKIPKSHLYVVASSGVFASVAKNPKAVAAGQKALSAAILKGTGRTLDFITVEQEVELTIAGVVPKQFRATSVLIDIGSGNTKGGYPIDAKKYASFGVPYGTVTLADLAKKKYPDDAIAVAAARVSESALAPALRAEVKKVPALSSRPRVYLSGGSVWAMATFMAPQKRDTFTAISAADIAKYRKALQASPKEYPKVDLSAMKNNESRAAAEKELARVKKTFTPEQLLVGAEILSQLATEFEMGKEKKEVYFARYGYLGWILAYVARKSVE